MPSKKSALSSRAVSIANVFGTLGYISIIFQWLWTLLIVCYPLIISDHSVLMPNGQPQPTTTPDDISPVALVFAITSTVVVMIITVVMLVRLPKQIGQRGAKITHHAAEVIMPVITQKKVVTKKKRAKLSYRIIISLKAAAIILPLFGLLFTPSTVPLESAVIWALGIFCASWSIAYIGIQQVIGLITKTPRHKLW